MGRPPKRASDRKSRFLSFGVDKKRLQAYRDAAAGEQFGGNVSDFLRAAADALATQLGHPIDPTTKPPDELPSKP
jgi:hypothetical protein